MNTPMSMTNPPAGRCRAAWLAAMLTLIAGGSRAQEPGQESPAPAGREVNTASMKIADLQTAEGVAEREKAINDVIRDAFNAKSTAGVWQTLAGKKLVEIDPHAVALSALTKNLTIQRSHLNQGIVAAALEEARALFDPVLNLSFNYSDSRDFERKVTVSRFHKATTHCDPPPAPNNPPECSLIPAPILTADGKHNDFIFFDNSPVQFLGFDQPRAAGYRPGDVITAHPDGVTGDNEKYNADFTVTQQLPWGASINLNYETVYKVADFVNNAGSLHPTAGSYHRPWTVNTSLSYSIPVPGSAHYGPDAASADVQNHLARLNDERAVWDVKNVINATLLAVDLSYWNLVGAANNFYAALQNQQSVEQLLKKTEEMYQLREITDYSRAQVQAELERVRNQVEQAKNAYITASNALQPLLDGGADAVYLPIQYSVSLAAPLDVNPAQLKREQVAMNPLLQSQRYNVETADVLLRQSDINRQPNLTFNAGANFLQSNSVFGYHEWNSAMARVFKPDIISQNYSLQLTRQWGNVAAEAGYAQAGYNRDISELTLRSTENTLTHALSDAAVNLVSARARTDIARRNWQLVQTAYQKAVDQQRSRTVTEYEIIQQSQQLLQATNDWVNAVISAKQAEANWLAAVGELPSKYADRTAQTSAEEGRVKALLTQNIVPVFAGEKRHER